MTSILSGIAATVGRAFANIFYDAVVTRSVAGTIVDPNDPPTPTETTFACKAIVEVYSKRLVADGDVAVSDRKVLVLASSLSTQPVNGDRITVAQAGYIGTKFAIVDVGTDPATAVWECRGSA